MLNQIVHEAVTIFQRGGLFKALFLPFLCAVISLLLISIFLYPAYVDWVGGTLLWIGVSFSLVILSLVMEALSWLVLFLPYSLFMAWGEIRFYRRAVLEEKQNWLGAVSFSIFWGYFWRVMVLVLLLPVCDLISAYFAISEFPTPLEVLPRFVFYIFALRLWVGLVETSIGGKGGFSIAWQKTKGAHWGFIVLASLFACLDYFSIVSEYALGSNLAVAIWFASEILLMFAMAACHRVYFGNSEQQLEDVFS